MNQPKPNHICKNVDCTKGADGGRKHYYACDYCDRTLNKRSLACCDECYDAYQLQVLEARANHNAINLYPERTDKPQEKVKELFKKPVEEVKEDTLRELSEHKEDIETIGLGPTIDKINSELDEKAQSKKSAKSK